MLFESIDLYAEQWVKREQANFRYLSEWKDQVKELVVDLSSRLKGKFKSPKCEVLNQPDVKEKLLADIILVPTYKAANNVVVVCNKYYIETLLKELSINTTSNTNSTYVPCTESFDDILRSHANFVNSVGLEMSEEDKNLPHLYWTPKRHKTPLKDRFIAGSSKCTAKDLSCLLKTFLSTIKDGLIRYCASTTSCNRANMPVVITLLTGCSSSYIRADT